MAFKGRTSLYLCYPLKLAEGPFVIPLLALISSSSFPQSSCRQRFIGSKVSYSVNVGRAPSSFTQINLARQYHPSSAFYFYLSF